MNIQDFITVAVPIGILLLVLWFVLTHSPEFVTYTDLFTLWGGTLAIFTWMVDHSSRALSGKLEKLDNKIENFDEKFEKLDNKIEELYVKIEKLYDKLVK